MTQDNFDQALKAFLTRRPFRPFTIEMQGGGRIEVNHPEAVRRQKELVVSRGTSGIQTVFDCTSVIRFIDGTGV